MTGISADPNRALNPDHKPKSTSATIIDLEQTPQKPLKKIRILLVITRLTIGGDTNVVLDIASHFQNHPHFEAHLAVGPVPEGEIDLTHLAFERAIPTKVISNLVNRINPWGNLKALLELRALMIREKYDIVHTHSSVAGGIGRLAAVFSRVR